MDLLLCGFGVFWSLAGRIGSEHARERRVGSNSKNMPLRVFHRALPLEMPKIKTESVGLDLATSKYTGPWSIWDFSNGRGSRSALSRSPPVLHRIVLETFFQNNWNKGSSDTRAPSAEGSRPRLSEDDARDEDDVLGTSSRVPRHPRLRARQGRPRHACGTRKQREMRWLLMLEIGAPLDFKGGVWSCKYA